MFWKPTASLERLKQRADFLKVTRAFFEAREVMEVDTPLLCFGVATDPCLNAFDVPCEIGQDKAVRYLQTSPEFAMKRILAAGSGPIYYLGKAFRKGEVGSRHNPEFTMLEWYRPGWDHIQLINEVDELFAELLQTPAAERFTYQDLFATRFNVNPHLASVNTLQEIALQEGWAHSQDCPELDRDGWLDLLLVHGIEPELGQSRPAVVIDYPASQASLAKTRIVEGKEPYAVAERFEFYYRGIELANGYHELSCATEQRQRFEEDCEKRKSLGLKALPLDHFLLAALSSGFPESAGVAVGIDRLLMLKLAESNIAKVLPFAWESA